MKEGLHLFIGTIQGMSLFLIVFDFVKYEICLPSMLANIATKTLQLNTILAKEHIVGASRYEMTRLKPRGGKGLPAGIANPLIGSAGGI